MRRVATFVLGAGSVTLLLTFVVGGALAERVFVVTGLLFPGALLALADHQRLGRWRRLLPCGLTLLLEACAVVILLDLGGDRGPVVAMLLGLGLLPLIVVPLVHAATFRAPPVAPTSPRDAAGRTHAGPPR